MLPMIFTTNIYLLLQNKMVIVHVGGKDDVMENLVSSTFLGWHTLKMGERVFQEIEWHECQDKQKWA